MLFLLGEVSSSPGCLGWATLFYCGTPRAFHIIILDEQICISRQKEVYERKVNEINEDFVFKELKRLSVSKSTDLDDLPARFIKDGAEFLKIPISFIINKSKLQC